MTDFDSEIKEYEDKVHEKLNTDNPQVFKAYNLLKILVSIIRQKNDTYLNCDNMDKKINIAKEVSRMLKDFKLTMKYSEKVFNDGQRDSRSLLASSK